MERRGAQTIIPKKERARFDDERNRLSADIDMQATAASSVLEGLVNSSGKGSDAFLAVLEWNQLGKRGNAIIAAEQSIWEKIRVNALKRGDPQKLSLDYIRESNFSLCIDAAGHFLCLKILREKRKVVEQLSLTDACGTYLDLTEFKTSGPAILKIGGNHSMNDLFNNENCQSPAELFKIWIEADMIQLGKLTADKDQPGITITYPQTAIRAVRSGAEEVSALNDIDAAGFSQLAKTLVPNPSREEKELINKAASMLERVDKLRNRIFKAILNPDSPEFPALRDQAQIYLTNEDAGVRMYSILRLGITSPEKVRQAYRLAKRISRLRNENSAFFKSLTNSLRECANIVTSQDIQLLTTDHLPVFIKGGQDSASEAPTFEDLKELAKTMPQNMQHFIDPNAVEWGALKKPKSASLIFYGGSPTKFGINLEYQRKNADPLIMSLGFATRESFLDWNFLEDPDDPEMKVMRDNAMLAAKNILSFVKEQVEKKLREKQAKKAEREKEASLRNTQPEPKAPKPAILWTPREKVEKPEKPKPLTPIQAPLNHGDAPPADKKIKTLIVAPEGRNIKDFMDDGLPKNVQLNINEAIIRLDEDGIGEFKALTSNVRFEGKSVHQLTVGRFRVLAIQTNSLNGNNHGSRTFEIIKILNKKDVGKYLKTLRR